ncbi:hypothetical protein, partial [Mesorhizobium sp. M0678]|uniref:hypothetical protein n=1 Tax=Mesorhizobium sp. M0678 TaxID=2956985 RepID=UPI0033356553
EEPVAAFGAVTASLICGRTIVVRLVEVSANCLITDLQSEHFVDEKGALFPGALFEGYHQTLSRGNCG